MRQLPENFFGWNDHKSIMLTKFATLAAAMGCVVMALWMLYNLYMFLARIEKGDVFTSDNVLALRRISWCCTWAAALCLPVGAVLGLPFIFAIGVAAAFMALIVRVIKNAFAQAVKMKDELDYTV